MSTGLETLISAVTNNYNSKYQQKPVNKDTQSSLTPKSNQSKSSSSSSSSTTTTTVQANKKPEEEEADVPLKKNGSSARKNNETSTTEDKSPKKIDDVSTSPEKARKSSISYKLDSSESEDLVAPEPEPTDNVQPTAPPQSVEVPPAEKIKEDVPVEIPAEKPRYYKKVDFPDNFVDALVMSHTVIKERSLQDLQQNITEKNPHMQYYNYLLTKTPAPSMVVGNPLVVIDVLSQLIAKFEPEITTDNGSKTAIDLTKPSNDKNESTIKSSNMVNIVQFIKSFVNHLEKLEEVIRMETNADQLRASQQKVDSVCLSSRPTSTIVSLNENDLIAQQFAKATTFSMASLPPIEALSKNFTNLATAFHNSETSVTTQAVVQIDLDIFVKAFISAKNADLIFIKTFNDYLDEHEIPIDMTSIPDNCIKFLTNRTYAGAEIFKAVVAHLNLCSSFVIHVLHYYLITFFLIIQGKFESMGEVRSLRARASVNKYAGQDDDESSNDKKSNSERKKRKSSTKSSVIDASDDENSGDLEKESDDDEESDEDDKNNKYDPTYLAVDDDVNSILYQNDDDFKPVESQASDDDFNDADSSSDD